MAKPDPVQLADPRGDQPRPARLALIAIAACGSGLLVAFGISRAMSGPEVPVGAARGALASHTAEAAPTAPTSPAPVEHSISPARTAPPPAATLASAGVQPAPTGAAPPTPQVAEPKAPLPAPGPAAATAANTPQPAVPPAIADAAAARAKQKRVKPTFEQGVLAYVRCEGSELRNARFPCPRDRKLEEHVWSALAQLPNCTEADPGIGTAELRVTLNKSRASFEWKSPLNATSLDLRALAKCTGAKLSAARTPARLPHAVVSFKFGLE